MYCKSCNYATTDETEWRAHKKSEEHLTPLGNICACKKMYSSKSALKAHQKKCTVKETNRTFDLNFYVNDADAMPEILRDIFALTQEEGDFLEKIKAYALTTPHFRLDVVQLNA